MYTQRTATGHIRAPLLLSCRADPPRKAEVGGQWSQPVLAADWPGYVPPIDLPTATKVQLQEEGVHSTHEGHTLNTQFE